MAVKKIGQWDDRGSLTTTDYVPVEGTDQSRPHRTTIGAIIDLVLGLVSTQRKTFGSTPGVEVVGPSGSPSGDRGKVIVTYGGAAATGLVALIHDSGSGTSSRVEVDHTGAVFAYGLKSGASQAAAGAAADEVWVDTSSGNALRLGS